MELLDVGHLDPQVVKQYLHLTSEKFECSLREGKDPYGIEDVEILALGVQKSSKPVALALCSYHPTFLSADLHSLQVEGSSQHQGVGTELLEGLMKALQDKGCQYINTKYPVDALTTSYFERLLQQAGWSQPKLFVLQCYFASQLFNPSWLIRPYKLSESYEIFPWLDLTASDRKRVEFFVKQRGIPPLINPLLQEDKIESINSLGIRYKSDLVGWMITHRLSPTLISYAKLYILPEHRVSGNAIKMLIHSIKLHIESRVQDALLELNIEQSDTGWQNFVKRRLCPNAQKVVEIRHSWCELK